MMRFTVPFTVLFAGAQAAIVELDYRIVPGSTTGDTITIPNPDGVDFEVTPSAEITSGFMTVRFRADESGVIENGSAVVTALDFTGSTNLRATTGQQILGQDIYVDITGPLSGDQQSWSFGSLEGLSTYSESTSGTFDTVFGPTDCSGNLFNAGCLGLEALAGVEFPFAALEGDDVAVALQDGVFDGLNLPGYSTAENSFEVPLEAGGGIGAPLPIELSWVENERRLVVPEPQSMILALPGMVFLCRRRRAKCS